MPETGQCFCLQKARIHFPKHPLNYEVEKLKHINLEGIGCSQIRMDVTLQAFSFTYDM